MLIRKVAIVLALAGAASCRTGGRTLDEPGNGSFTFPRGTVFTIVLQTVGPGSYASPPTVTSAAVRFIDVSQAAVSVPAGPTQQFRFQAVSVGEAVIVFHHDGVNAQVSDTIVVR